MDNIQSSFFSVENIRTQHDIKAIKRGLDALPGVSSVSVDKSMKHLAVDYDITGVSEDRLRNTLSAMGFIVTGEEI